MPRKKDIVELIIISVLIFILLLLGMKSLGRIRRAKRIKSAPKSLTTTYRKRTSAGETRGQTEGIYKHLEQEAKNLKIKRDPFAFGSTISTPETTASDLSLVGILWDKVNPLAIIDDNIVKIGDSVGSNKVVDIRQDRVILNDGINDFELNLD